MDKKIGTAEELGERLSLKPKTIRDWARQGKIPSLRISPKVIRFDFNEVEEALKSRAIEERKKTDRVREKQFGDLLSVSTDAEKSQIEAGRQAGQRLRKELESAVD